MSHYMGLCAFSSLYTLALHILCGLPLLCCRAMSVKTAHGRKFLIFFRFRLGLTLIKCIQHSRMCISMLFGVEHTSLICSVRLPTCGIFICSHVLDRMYELDVIVSACSLLILLAHFSHVTLALITGTIIISCTTRMATIHC